MLRRAFLGLVLVACSDPAPVKPSSAPVAVTTPSASASASCPTASAPVTVGNLSAKEVDETSGIVASKRNPGVFWVHNDSGDSARAFAISGTGKLLTTLTFDTAMPQDIEDIAIEDAADGSSYLYLADIGDNTVSRSDIVIHRIPEPSVVGAAAQLTATSDKMHVKYIDGPHDAETLLFDPLTRELFVVTKLFFGSGAVHRIGPWAGGQTVTTTKIGSVPISLADGGDISRDGTKIAIRNYTGASLWTRAPGESLATALARPFCPIPLAQEPQGEALGFLADGTGYVTMSEGVNAALNIAHFTP
jgi:hypothetical protein